MGPAAKNKAILSESGVCFTQSKGCSRLSAILIERALRLSSSRCKRGR